jgi:hypothetical protein
MGGSLLRRITLSVVLGALAAFWIALPASASSPASTTVDRSATLSTSNQNMWHSGSPNDATYTLFDKTWNASASGGAIQHVSWPLGFDPTPAVPICDPFTDFGDPTSSGFGEVDDDDCTFEDPTHADDNLTIDIGDFGATGSVSSKGEVGMSLKFNGWGTGKIGVDYPVTSHFTQPAADTFAPGDQVTIDTSNSVGSAAAITTTFPDLQSIDLNGVFGFDAGLTFNLCVFSCTGNTSVGNLTIPSGYDGTNPATGTILHVAIPGTQCFNFIVGFVGGFGHAPDGYTRCHSDVTNTNSGYVGFPNVTTTSKLNADGTISASGEDPYAVVPVSAVTWAQRIIPGAGTLVPLNIGPAEIPGSGGITAGWSTANLVFSTIEKLKQDMMFTPRVDVTLDWGRTLDYQVKTPGGTVIGSGPGTGATFPLGDKLFLTTPSNLTGSLHVTPTLSMGSATFTNHTLNSTEGEGTLSALALNLKTPSAKFDIGYGVGEVTVWPGTSIDVGPVINENFPLATTNNDVFNSSWTLGGFNSPTVNDLLLTPDPLPVPTAATVTPTEGASFSGTVASFTDPDTTGGASDYTATIDWGDGTSATTGGVVDGGGGLFHVTGTHTYAEEGSNSVTVTVQDKDTTNVNATAHSTANVADAALHATGTSLTATEGAAFSNVKVASFTDDDPAGAVGDFGATIHWGDGSSSTGTITANGSGGWDVAGSHTYAEEGSPTITVDISDHGASVSPTSSMSVADAALHASPRQNSATTGSPSTPLLLWPAPPGSGVVATFTDDDPAGRVADYTATIHWGDGTSSSGTVATNAAGAGFQVSGSHTYATTGFYTMTVDVYDVGDGLGGSHDSATTRLLTYMFSSTGGNFVISSRALGSSPVTFWSSDWALRNGLAGPTAFKGFANSPANASAVNCTSAAGWSSNNGGNSPSPPPTVPAFMSLLVSPSVSPSGSGFAGVTTKMVVAQTNPGYGPSPGHPGTATIAATICG